MVTTFRLANGLQVAIYNMPTVKSLHIGMSVKGGSIIEKVSENGLAHYMEHMLVQGSPSFPTAQELSNFIESLAGRYGASTSKFLVHFFLSVPFSHLEDALKITSETFFEPLFPKAAMEKERHAVLNELKQHMDSKWYKYNEFVRHVRYASDSLLKREIIGKEKIIDKLTREDLVRYWQYSFSPENMYLFIGGNFDPAKLKELLNQYFGNQKTPESFIPLPKLDNTEMSNRRVALRHDDEFQMNYIDLSFPGINTFSAVKENQIQNIALLILGQLRTSRLFRLLRYEKGLVYGVYADDSLLLGTGLVSITSEVAPEHLDEVVTTIADETKKFIESGPTEDELAFAKHFLSNRWLMSFDNPSNIQGWVEGEFIWKDMIRLPEDYIEIVEKITVADTKQLMQEKWDLSKLNLIIQGPIKETAANEKKYTKMIENLK